MGRHCRNTHSGRALSDSCVSNVRTALMERLKVNVFAKFLIEKIQAKNMHSAVVEGLIHHASVISSENRWYARGKRYVEGCFVKFDSRFICNRQHRLC